MTMPGKVRVRFAPSPTGPLHIGGVRTALFNYLFARKQQGKFILRFEDTDQVRFVPGAEQYILDSLMWCGLHYDEGPDRGGPFAPYRQSERKAIYRQYAEQLLASGNAYYAFDNPEELDARRRKDESDGKIFQYDALTRLSLRNSLALPDQETRHLISSGEAYVIRFKMPEAEELKITDLIRGELRFQTSLLDDKVLFKADGMPTYHLANVVDDYLMQITHVIRGEEWLPSLPLHVLLYRTLDWTDAMPAFAHLPLILKPGVQGKLSKRDGAKMGFPVIPLQWTDPDTGEVSMGYREAGYFPEAMVNILALLGWNPGTDQELFSLDELIEAFSLDRVGKSGARFDPDKAKWFNQQYLKRKTDEELADLYMMDLQNRGIIADHGQVIRIVKLVRERLVFASELWDQSWYFFRAPESYDVQMARKVWKQETPQVMQEVKALLQESGDFTSAGLEQTLKHYVEEKNLAFGKVMTPLRLLMVGSGMGPHLFDILEIAGRQEVIRRIEKGISRLQQLQ
jgi:glutamyl-tRNA synthetase